MELLLNIYNVVIDELLAIVYNPGFVLLSGLVIYFTYKIVNIAESTTARTIFVIFALLSLFEILNSSQILLNLSFYSMITILVCHRIVFVNLYRHIFPERDFIIKKVPKWYQPPFQPKPFKLSDEELAEIKRKERKKLEEDIRKQKFFTKINQKLDNL